MNETLFEILKYAIYVAILVVARYIIPYVKLKLEDSKYANILDIIEKGINAAESIYKGISKSGEEKKEFVIDWTVKYAEKNKINITKEQIEILLEAIFNELDGISINVNKVEK